MMRNWKVFIGVFFFCIVPCLVYSLDRRELTELVEKNNANLDYKSSFIAFHEILTNPKTSLGDKSYVYYHKYQILKKLSIYSEALENLELAYSYAKKTEMTKVQTRYDLERAVTYCEMLEYSTAMSLFEKMEVFSIDLSAQELGFYLFLKGIVSLESLKDYHKAVTFFNEAIIVLKNNNPAYLPVIYKELIKAYALLGEDTLVEDSYTKGVKYANKYQWNSELLQLHRFMAVYYRQIHKVKESLELSQLVLLQSTEFNVVNISGSLNLLEKELLEKDKESDFIKITYIQKLLFAGLSVLCLLVVLYFWKYRKNRESTVFIAKENTVLNDDFKALQLASISTIQQNGSSIQNQVIANQMEDLTQRQKQIIYLVKLGKTNKDIAQELFISENTVKYHLKIIYDVLKIKGRVDLL